MPTKTKTVLDTNIFVYAYDANSSFHQKAVAHLSDPGFDFFTTTKNISELFAVLSKQNQPFAKVFQFYQSILANTTLLFPTLSSLAIFEI
ncbi:MAG: PIN domain-containing protein, partial [Bacteroidota bacterium]